MRSLPVRFVSVMLLLLQTVDTSTQGHKVGHSKGQTARSSRAGSSQSKQSPTVPIDGTSPEALARSVNAHEVN